MTTSHASSSTHRIAAIGLMANVGLALVKLVCGVLGHSGALVADAAESLADIAGSVVIWSGLHIGAMPADEDHPYGHGKAEALAGLAVSCILIAAGIAIAIKAVHDIRTPHEPPAAWTLVVLAVVIVLKYTLYLKARQIGRREGSGAITVDAGHHVADAITSIATAVGIFIAVFGPRIFNAGAMWGYGWETADDFAALIASAIIVWNAGLLLRVPLRELMDTTTAEDQERVIAPARDAALSVPGVLAIEKTFARKSGGGYWLDMHVQVAPTLSVSDAHVIGGKVRAHVRRTVAGVRDVLIHMEPHEVKHDVQPFSAGSARATTQTTPD